MMTWLFRILGITAIWEFVKPSFMENGVASAKKLSAFFIIGLYGYGHIRVFFNLNIKEDTDFYFKLFCLDALFVVVLFGILTAQNLITIFRLKNNIIDEVPTKKKK